MATAVVSGTNQSMCACVMVVRVVWAVRARFEWLAWMETVGGVDDKQNCDREGGQDGRAACFLFEAQRPIVALPAGVVGYDVIIRSSVGRRCSGASKVSSLCRPGLTCAAIDNRVGISVHRIVCSNSTQMLRSEVC